VILSLTLACNAGNAICKEHHRSHTLLEKRALHSRLEEPIFFSKERGRSTGVGDLGRKAMLSCRLSSMEPQIGLLQARFEVANSKCHPERDGFLRDIIIYGSICTALWRWNCRD
jgi:hypothetical protein